MNHSKNLNHPQAIRIANIIKKYTPFLKNYSFVKFYEKNGGHYWLFSHKFPEYTFKVIFAEKNDMWSAKIFVYWKKETKESTMGAGKDFDYKIGPNKDFSDLLKNIELKLKNNPVMGYQLYEDDFELNMDKEAIPLIKLLKKSIDKLNSIEDPFFEDLKKIYKRIKNIPENKLLDYCRIHNSKEADKQDFILDLQKLHKLDYYLAMKRMGQKA